MAVYHDRRIRRKGRMMPLLLGSTSLGSFTRVTVVLFAAQLLIHLLST
jgi:hypothetical protein